MGSFSFTELKPALLRDAALAEANRCLSCFDAPCTRACPTHIDVPGFIKKIASGNLLGSAKTIFAANVLGASCARVCPTEVLCEGACVFHDLERPPIAIGQLQRYATDWAMAHRDLARPFVAASQRSGKVAIIGAGPAGLACGAELLRLGHDCVLFDAAPKPGGLNTTGVAEYKMTPSVSLAEVEWLESAGLEIRRGVRIGVDISVAELERDFDLIFVGVGLGGVGPLGVPGDQLDGVVDAIDFIARLKADRAAATAATTGKRVAVIGGGNTAVDAVTQAAALGAAEVTMVYRRGPEEIGAYHHELELAKRAGCRFLYLASTRRVLGEVHVTGLELDRMQLGEADESGRRRPEPIAGEPQLLAVDIVIAATGQKPQRTLLDLLPDVARQGTRVQVDENLRTTNPRYYAGGDCVSGGQEVVNAVAEGKRAAAAMSAVLQRSKNTEAGR